jgi:RNA polymerase sigma-70 factor (ECF subfamily)
MTEPNSESSPRPFNESPLFHVFHACVNELRSFLTRRVGCPDVAADIVQDTFVRLAMRSERDQHTNPRALVFRVAANLATDHVRHQRIRDKFDAGSIDDFAVASSAPAPDAVIAARQEDVLLKHAIALLPEKRRMVFLLRMSQELSYGQIAERLGISVSAVEKHMSKAIVHCRVYLERQSGVSQG